MKTVSAQTLAVLLFFTNQLQGVVREILVRYYGMGEFIATSYTNRVYALIVLVLVITSLSIPRKISRYVFKFAIVLSSIVLYSLVKNSFSDFVADLFLISIPFIFVQLFSRYSEEDCSKFLLKYYQLNIAILAPAIILKFVGVRFLIVDYTFLVVYLATAILSSGFRNEGRKFGLYVNLSLALFHGIGKVIIAQSAAFLFVRSVSPLKRLLLVVSSLFFFTYFIQLFEENSQQSNDLSYIFGSLPRGVELLRKTNFEELTAILSSNASTLVKDPQLIFQLTDLSTGQRVFEFLSSVATVNVSTLTFLFGEGLGGVLPYSPLSDDESRNTNVRIVHLLPSFLLLKFGYLLGGIISIIIIRHFYRAFSLVRNYGGANILPMLGSLGIVFYIIGAMFTFSVFIKDPMLGFYLHCYFFKRSKFFV